MYTYTHCERLIRSVTYLEVRQLVDQIQRQVTDESNVSTFIRLRYATDDHVSVADSLDLSITYCLVLLID